MEFKEWFEITEARLDPQVTTPKSYRNANDKPYLSRTFALTVDEKGNVVPHDYTSRKPYLELQPNNTINLQRLGPQSTEFRRIINALRPKYPDIDQYRVQHYFQSGHMQAAGARDRTVGYWMGRPEVRLANKLPKYFYHGTSTNSWYEAIKQKGLAPRRMTGSTGGYGSQNISSLSYDDLVYVATDPDAATREAALQASRKYGGSPLIIRIDTTGLDPNKLAPDEDTKAATAQGSVDMASVLAYRGRIPAGNLEPFLIGNRITKNNRYQTDWKRFEDVPMTEHPLTTKLKNGEVPYRDDPEYYALKDAGIIGTEKYTTIMGDSNTRTVILDKEITDEKIREVLKKSGWTQNVKAIKKDLDEGYRGALYMLKGVNVTEEEFDSEILRLLLASDIVSARRHSYRGQDYITLDVESWDYEPKAIKLAKLMGRMSFGELAAKIKRFAEDKAAA